MPIVVGVDENGLGPRLGPLVVTAVALETAPGGERAALSKPSKSLADRLADSKALVRWGESSLGEAWARAIARRLGVAHAANPDALVHALALEPRQALRALCPS